MIVSILTTMREKLMNCLSIERLKRDRKEALHYRRKLRNKGKDVLASKMTKKLAKIDEHLFEMKTIIGGK
tara:strand:+ start:1766 stop:1975 length:210 start_codon:yes stop_codon:yes gene_type:complete